MVAIQRGNQIYLEENEEMAKGNNTPQNRSASIRFREDRRGNLRTETFRRDDDTVKVAVSTDPEVNSTMLYVDSPDGDTFTFDGRTARTIYRALQKHYFNTGKTW